MAVEDGDEAGAFLNFNSVFTGGSSELDEVAAADGDGDEAGAFVLNFNRLFTRGCSEEDEGEVTVVEEDDDEEEEDGGL